VRGTSRRSHRITLPVLGDCRTGAFYGRPLEEGPIGRFRASERVYAPRQTIARHRHERPYLCYVVSGGYRERTDAGEVEAHPGMVLLHPADAAHSDRFEETEARLFMLEIPAQWLEELRAPAFRQPAVYLSGAVAVLGGRIRCEALMRDQFTPLAIEGLLLELLAASMRISACPSSTPPPAWLRRARAFLEEASRRPPTLGELGKECGVHPSHLARTFRLHYGRSIGAYVRELRVSRAKELLGSPSRRVSLADVALACGFADQSHLTRVFRRLEGVTPASYRRAFLH
jgi:AraC family transcriptional regulator